MQINLYSSEHSKIKFLTIYFVKQAIIIKRKLKEFIEKEQYAHKKVNRKKELKKGKNILFYIFFSFEILAKHGVCSLRRFEIK